MVFGRGNRPDTTASRTGSGETDSLVDEVYGPTNERSDVIAFLVGGVVMTGGLLTLLYLGGDNAGQVLSRADGFLRLETEAPRISSPIEPAPKPTAQPTN